MKKRIGSLLVCFILSVSVVICFCSCGMNKEKIDSVLEGQWSYSWYASAVNKYCYSEYEFHKGEVQHYFKGSNEYYDVGTYEITKDTIDITWTDGNTHTLNYTYDGEYIKLIDMGNDGTICNEYQKIT